MIKAILGMTYFIMAVFKMAYFKMSFFIMAFLRHIIDKTYRVKERDYDKLANLIFMINFTTNFSNSSIIINKCIFLDLFSNF